MRKKRKRDFRNTSAAFTSVELLACITACALLVAVITPVLTTSRSRSDRVACVNNLRHLEKALRQFAMENYDYPPWRQFAPAGNYYEPGKHQLWFQYWWLREGIGSPKYLMDPGETRTGRGSQRIGTLLAMAPFLMCWALIAPRFCRALLLWRIVTSSMRATAFVRPGSTGQRSYQLYPTCMSGGRRRFMGKSGMWLWRMAVWNRWIVMACAES